MSKKSTPSKAGVTYRASSRRNGWSCPPHPLQFVAWVFIATFAVMYHGVAVPTIPYHWQPACHMIVGVVLAVHVVTHLVCLTINPADPNTLRRDKNPMPEFDRTRHKHVIENNHCYLCEVDVGLKSKHCSSCNKCVADFDHHCKWLNNCVGSRNYRWFITCLSSAFLCCLFVFTVFLYISIVYWVNPQLLHPELYDAATTTQSTITVEELLPTAVLLNNSLSPTTETPDPLLAHRNGLKIFMEVSGTAFVVVAIVLAVLLFMTLCLLGHLLGFHMFLICHDMSTYDYVMQDRNAFNSGDVEAQKTKPRQKGCCKCNNQVAPHSEAKEELEMTETKKDSISQLKSNNNSNSNLQQQLVVSEPLIKQQQQQQQGKQEQQSLADSKPKSKKKKKAKRKSQHMPSLTARESLQPALLGHPNYPPSQMNLTHSMPQTYLEQHLVRRFSLPLVTPAGMHPQYPVAEPPVQDLFFTQQFPTMQRPIPNPQDGPARPWRPIPPPTTINCDSPTPALDYHSSSAESLVEVPIGRAYHRGSFSHPAQKSLLPGGQWAATGYQQPLDKWQQSHNSHPNLTTNSNQQRAHTSQPLPGVSQRDSNTNNTTHLKSKRISAKTKKREATNVSSSPSEIEKTGRRSIKEPLLVKTVQGTESKAVPAADKLDRKSGNLGKRTKKQRSPESVETTAEVHRQLDGHSKVAIEPSNVNQKQRTPVQDGETKLDVDPNLQDRTRSETGTRNGQVPQPKAAPVAAPRRRTLKLGQEPSGSQISLQSSLSRQHLLEDGDSNPPSSGRCRKDQLQETTSQDAVSLPGSIPEVPPLDLRPLAGTQDSNVAAVTHKEPSGQNSHSNEQLVEGYSSEDIDPRPVSRRRSLLLRY